MATRTDLNQILVSFSPTFSNLLHRAKCSRLDGERPLWGLPLDSVTVPWKMKPDGLQSRLGEFLGRFEGYEPLVTLLESACMIPESTQFLRFEA